MKIISAALFALFVTLLYIDSGMRDDAMTREIGAAGIKNSTIAVVAKIDLIISELSAPPSGTLLSEGGVKSINEAKEDVAYLAKYRDSGIDFSQEEDKGARTNAQQLISLIDIAKEQHDKVSSMLPTYSQFIDAKSRYSELSKQLLSLSERLASEAVKSGQSLGVVYYSGLPVQLLKDSELVLMVLAAGDISQSNISRYSTNIKNINSIYASLAKNMKLTNDVKNTLSSIKSIIPSFNSEASRLLSSAQSYSDYTLGRASLLTTIKTIKSETVELSKEVLNSTSHNNDDELSLYIVIGAYSSLLLSILFFAIGYRLSINASLESSANEKRAYDAFRSDVAALESGDLRIKLAESHSHTGNAAKAVNGVVTAFRSVLVNLSPIVNKMISVSGDISRKAAENKATAKKVLDASSAAEQDAKGVAKASTLVAESSAHILEAAQVLSGEAGKLQKLVIASNQAIGNINMLSKVSSNKVAEVINESTGIADRFSNLKERFDEIKHTSININMALAEINHEDRSKIESAVGAILEFMAHVSQEVERSYDSAKMMSAQLEESKVNTSEIRRDLEKLSDSVKSTLDCSGVVISTTDSISQSNRQLSAAVSGMQHTASHSIEVISSLASSANSMMSVLDEFNKTIAGIEGPVEEIKATVQRFKIQ